MDGTIECFALDRSSECLAVIVGRRVVISQATNDYGTLAWTDMLYTID